MTDGDYIRNLVKENNVLRRALSLSTTQLESRQDWVLEMAYRILKENADGEKIEEITAEDMFPQENV